ncbi:MAG: Lpg1974 family pore-forming outer membrane protein [Lacipirellulaceae bacterium]
MRLKRWGTAALALCLCITGMAQAQQQGGREYQTADAVIDENVDLASYNDCNTGCSVDGCSSCGGDGGMLGGIMDRPLMLIAGAEYIYARANFSQALSYIENDTVNNVVTFNQYDFDYNSSYGFYGGIADCCCGGAIIFDFQRLRSDAVFGPISDDTAAGIVNIVPFEVNPPANGFTNGFASVDLQSYGASFQKTIPLGSPLCADTCCDCGDTCCGDDCCGDSCCGDSCCGSGCGCGWCPAWDLTWRGGIRWANVDWSRGANAFDTTTGTAVADDSYVTQLDFEGFGFRTGLEGRRYFGRRGRFSVFAGGDISVLLGDINIRTTVVDGGTPSVFQDSCTHIVPVTEVEMGGTYHIGCHASITAGYFFSAWHDLGMRDEYETNLQMSHYDDANILGFDGLFARAEVAF